MVRRNYTWTIGTAPEILEKAKRELERFRTAHESGDDHQVDHAFNCAVTLWHIHGKRRPRTLVERPVIAR